MSDVFSDPFLASYPFSPSWTMLWLFVAFFWGYFWGSIPFGVLVSKLFSLPDPRRVGSRNPGFSNVLRSGNKWAALAVGLGDVGKGAFAVWTAQRFLVMWVEQLVHASEMDWFVAWAVQYTYGPDMALVAGFAAILGHILPLWLKFRGGKGVATSLGVFLVLSPVSGLILLLTWFSVARISGYASIASLFAFLLAPLLVWWRLDDVSSVLFCLVLLVLMLIRHRRNLGRLRRGEEPRLRLGAQRPQRESKQERK